MPTDLTNQPPSISAPVLVYETPSFATGAARLLSPTDVQALRLLLASDPLTGTPADDIACLFRLVYHDKHIDYSFAENTVFLILISEDLPPPPGTAGDQEDYKKSKELGMALAKGGMFALGKKLIDLILGSL